MQGSSSNKAIELYNPTNSYLNMNLVSPAAPAISTHHFTGTSSCCTHLLMHVKRMQLISVLVKLVPMPHRIQSDAYEAYLVLSLCCNVLWIQYYIGQSVNGRCRADMSTAAAQGGCDGETYRYPDKFKKLGSTMSTGIRVSC